MRILGQLAVILLLVVGRASAGPQLFPISYDMLNGQAGFLAYHDQTYSGAGDTTSDLAPLSGGVGDLTDSIFGADIVWNIQEQADPWVGWRGINPAITFSFSELIHVTEIRLSTLRNSAASIQIPSMIGVASGAAADSLGAATNFFFTDSAFPDNTLQTLILPVSNSGNVFQLQITDPQWAIFSEIQFFGTALPGDATLDGIVDGADYTVWADNFDDGTGPGGKKWTQGDFTGEGYVTGADYVVWADHFLQNTNELAPSLAVSAVPEPSTIALATSAILMLLTRRARDPRRV